MVKARTIVGIDYGADARVGLRAVLTTRLDEMCSLSGKALDWSDPKGVHDMRVASRRLRSVLRDFKPLLRGRKMREWIDDVKTLADTLGDVRDQDVAIIALEDLAKEVPGSLRTGIKQFAEERATIRRDARDTLAATLDDQRIDELHASFVEALDEVLKPSSGISRDDGPERLSFRHECVRIIHDRLSELQKLGAGLYRPLKARPLHRMRIAAKRLRYAIELYTESCRVPLKKYSKEIAQLQTSLGELHDSDLWIEAFGEYLANAGEAPKSKGDEDAARPESFERSAAVWLLRHFVKARTHHYRNALTRWDGWLAARFFERLSEQLNGQADSDRRFASTGSDNEPAGVKQDSSDTSPESNSLAQGALADTPTI